jgi:hypothetical protein
VNHVRILFLVVLLCTGCGTRRKNGVTLTGAVTFNGRPVPAGQVVFLSEGRITSSGIAVIKDGVYRTVDGREPVSGPQVVRFQLCDGVRSGMAPYGQLIAPVQEIEVTLAQAETTRDFHLPPQQAPK